MDLKDRRARLLLPEASLNGIDFVEVANDQQTALRVHFLNAVPLKGTVSEVTITGGESIHTVAVAPIDDNTDWSLDDTHLVLKLSAATPGDFSNYTLAINSPLLDLYFAKTVFSFKARCPSDLDCQPQPVVCLVPPSDAPPIDYLAKDFLSFRQALLDFSALRYPEWQERSEADFGVMFLEALCALADELSYMQDRIAAEAALPTATQRRSVVRLARLVDYWPRPATAASVLLQFDVADGVTEILDGLVVTASGPDGAPIPFETGTKLANRFDPETGQLLIPQPASPVSPTWNVTLQGGYGGSVSCPQPASPVNPAWNRGVIRPYWFDNSQRCLRAGATEMYVLGCGFNFYPGQPLLIETGAQSSADPPIRQFVRLVDADQGPAATELCDPLFAPSTDGSGAPPPVLFCPTSPPQGTCVTLIRWRTEDALTTDRDLTRTILAGNLIIATQAQTRLLESFVIPPPPDPQSTVPEALVCTGPNDTPSDPSLQYLYTLRTAPLAWLQPDDAAQPPAPEVVLTGQPSNGEQQVLWQFQPWLLKAEAFDNAFTIDAARFSRIAGTVGDSLRSDYDGDAGDTLRFGDGVFGVVPVARTTFNVTYRTGGGLTGNVAPDSITAIDPKDPKANGVLRVTNPLPATGGADPEPLDTVRRLAPEKFRAVQYRAVLPADYQAAAETLSWVQRAGTVFRWTGSWLTVFTTPDPRHSEQITVAQRTELINLLNRYRMAGYESYVPDPKYVSLDLVVELCARPESFRGDVEQTVLTALGTAPGGFFNRDNFTFGQPLQLSALEGAVQRAQGVAGVTCVRYRIRGRTPNLTRMGDTVAVGVDEIIRCDNDPSLPERGSLKVIIQGGK
jgi:hypothetical protein